ncbi:pre-mRNA processing RNA-helicase, partial [Rhizoclosmatium hyalinum]
SLKPVVSKLSPFTSSFGVSSKPGVTSSLKVSTPSGNVFDEDDEGSNETVGLDARGRKLKGVVALNEEEPSTTTDMDVDKKEETDELEAFMVDVNSEVKKLAEEDLKTLKSVNAAAVVAGAAAAAAMETESAVGDAKKTGGGDEDGEGEAGDDDDDDIMGAAAKLFAGKRKELSQIDHSLQNYAPFRKDFYVEPREIAEMTPAEVEIKRAELGGIIIRGVKCPKPIEKWTQMGLPTSVADVIKKGLKYEKPSGIQAQSIPAVMSGRDVIGIAKTGSGKTIAFLLPMFRHIKDQDPLKTGDGPIALIMTPTRELATQIHRECKHFTKALNLRAVCCYGGAPIKDQIAELKRGAEIIICTPGRMIDLLCANSGRVCLIWVLNHK